jgi:hypothetical protein
VELHSRDATLIIPALIHHNMAERRLNVNLNFV